MATAELSRLNMYYQLHGEGETVVLLMGVTMDHSYWIMQTPEFGKHYQVLAFDNRGVGRTDSPPPPYDTRMMADDVAELMDSLGIEKAHLIGLALGGCVAQEFAIKYANRVRSLVLASSSACPQADAPRSMFLGDTMLMLAQAGFGLEMRTRTMVPWVLSEGFFDSPEQVQMVVNLTLATPCPQEAVGLEGQVIAGRRHDTRDRLSEIQAPTLVIVGKEDLVLPVECSQKLAEGIPNAQLHIMNAGGHLACYEYPTRFNQTVLEFLEALR
jgi:pimeloyl-ACP methyl ester carboxylesterase